eukprot:TRINITY_DN4730_c0_g1_i14.p1 TRINITY_DN4730_c0_g1~~TRINITY_DN4730_c0_g1_i14.p1  ORF type:complete len:233 (-),score=52.55 TRINITY_DN4730_c0_g1_i14:478-1176(-)
MGDSRVNTLVYEHLKSIDDQAAELFKSKVQLQELPEDYPNLEQIVAYHVYHSKQGNVSRKRRQAEATVASMAVPQAEASVAPMAVPQAEASVAPMAVPQAEASVAPMAVPNNQPESSQNIPEYGAKHKRQKMTSHNEVVVVDSPPKPRRSSREPVKVQVTLIRLTGERISVKIKVNATIEELKRAVERKIGLPPDEQRIIFAGRQLCDELSLAFYKVQDGSTLHLGQRLRGD